YLGVPRTGATATLLNNGTVLVVGGQDATPVTLVTAESYTVSYDPQGGVSLSSDNGNQFLAGADIVVGCTLSLTGTGAGVCDGSIMPKHVNGGTHTLTAQFLSDWAANTSYTANFLILPTVNNASGFLFEATTAGTSGNSEPNSWNQNFGQTTPDASAIWTNVGLPNHSSGVADATQTLTVN